MRTTTEGGPEQLGPVESGGLFADDTPPVGGHPTYAGKDDGCPSRGEALPGIEPRALAPAQQATDGLAGSLGIDKAASESWRRNINRFLVGARRGGHPDPDGREWWIIDEAGIVDSLPDVGGGSLAFLRTDGHAIPPTARPGTHRRMGRDRSPRDARRSGPPPTPDRFTFDRVSRLIGQVEVQARTIMSEARWLLCNGGWTIVRAEELVSLGNVTGHYDLLVAHEVESDAIVDLKTGSRVSPAVWYPVGGLDLYAAGVRHPAGLAGVLHVTCKPVGKPTRGILEFRPGEELVGAWRR